MQPHKQWCFILTDLWAVENWADAENVSHVTTSQKDTRRKRDAATRRRSCHQSWRGRWQRLVRHTEDSCSPEWKRHLQLSQTASQCSPLKYMSIYIYLDNILILPLFINPSAQCLLGTLYVHSKKCWVISTQIWIKYWQIQ